MKNRWHFMIMVFLFVWGCQKDPTAISNGKPNQKPAGPHPPREYVWTMDTLSKKDLLGNIMYDIWGSSAKDVYTVGFSSQSHGKIYHYDGNSWHVVKLPISNPLRIQLESIHGFSDDNIYAAGTRSEYAGGELYALLLHFDGQQWQEISLDGKGLQAVWGFSSTDLWIGGLEGTLQHFDGHTWTQYVMQNSINILDFKGFASDDTYALAYSMQAFYLFHWNGNKWSLQNSYQDGKTETFGSFQLEVIGDAIYSVGYGGVFRKSRTDTIWENIFDTKTLFGICGDAPDNLFVVGRGGRAYHFNGEDWYLYHDILYPDLEYTSCWYGDKELFITATNYAKSFILHGK